MKRSSTFVLLIALFAGMAIPAWGQTSTQGKEFWVSLIPSQDPENKGEGFDPYIAISSLKACVVKISNPNTGWSIVENVAKESWKQIQIPQEQWYVTNNTSKPATETPLNYGLKVESTEEISVYCSLRWKQSFDATNILPVTALQSEYIVQIYGTTSASNGFHQCLFGILAAEDCVVDITPSVNTGGGKPANTTFNVSLKKGQTYYVMSATDQDLSGSHIKARDNKKIAIFVGSPAARVPNDYSDRDLLYEQIFPIDYWGQEFIVTRSAHKDANRIIITAQEDNTQVTIYGKYDPSASQNGDHTIRQNYTLTLDAGKSYEFELSAGYEEKRWDSKRENLKGITVIDSTAYIKTSCPCAVMSYDSGNSYKRKDNTELESKNNDGKNWLGAPAMTWVSPIEQMINEVVFGVMGTDMTTVHYVNIIVNTSDVPNVTLNNVSLKSNFKPTENNPEYSYARIKLRETTPGGSNPFYHLKSKNGFIATVYGNGDDESYAYSVGSSAVKRGVNIDGVKFVDHMRADEPFCINNTLVFNPQVSTDVIDKVVWDFGDGTSLTTTIEDGIIAEHTYTTPGWYDMTAYISAHKDCPYSSYPEEAVTFSFRVVEADTIPVGSAHDCIEADSTYNGVKLTAEEIQKMLTYGANDTAWEKRVNCYDPVEFTIKTYGIKTTYSYSVEEKDSALVNGTWYYPETVPTDGKVTWTLEDGNRYGCDSIITCNLKVLSCLDVELVNTSAETQYICQGRQLEVPYTVKKGEIISATFTIDNQAPEELSLNHTTRGDGTAVLPTETLVPGVHHAVISMEDTVCEKVLDKHYDFVVRYPDDIFAFKYNNVLAVYQKGYGGNTDYDFTGYQWYRNGQKIEGATSAVYYTEAPFTPGDIYYVELTNMQNVPIPSCGEFVVPDEQELDDYTPKKAPAATKKLINRHMYIVVEDKMYDAYGQRVQ